MCRKTAHSAVPAASSPSRRSSAIRDSNGAGRGSVCGPQRAAINPRVLDGGLDRRARPMEQILSPMRALFLVMKKIQLWSVDRAENKLCATAVEHRGPTELRAHGC